MIRLLQRHRSIIPKTLTLIPSHHYSTTTNHHHRRNKNHRKPAAPPFDPSLLDAAISRLPPRFTPSDLTSFLAAEPNPHLCHRLLLWSASHPRRFLPSPSSFLLTIKKLGSARLYPELHSLSLLARSLPLPPSEPLLNTTLYFYCEARMLSQAISLYKHALTSQNTAARPTARTYHLLFTAFLGRGPNSYINHVYMDTVRLLFRHMINSGIPADALALNAIIRGYVGALHLNDALRVFHQMEPVYSCQPDAHTYGALVHGLSAQGRTRNAMQLWDEARGKGMVPAGCAGNSLACALAMAGEVEGAVGMVWEMAGMGRAADRVTCKTVLEEMCRRERGAEAMELLRELRDKEVVDERTYRELLNEIQDEFGGAGLLSETGIHGIE